MSRDDELLVPDEFYDSLREEGPHDLLAGRTIVIDPFSFPEYQRGIFGDIWAGVKSGVMSNFRGVVGYYIDQLERLGMVEPGTKAEYDEGTLARTINLGIRPEWRERTDWENLKDPHYLAYLAGSGLGSFGFSAGLFGTAALAGGPLGVPLAGLLLAGAEIEDARSVVEQAAEKLGVDLPEDDIHLLAMGVGLGSAALDLLPAHQAWRGVRRAITAARGASVRSAMAEASVKKLAADPLWRSTLQSALEGLKTGSYEGLTELAQQMLKEGTAAAVVPGYEPNLGEALGEGIAGFFGGNVMALPHVAIGFMRERFPDAATRLPDNLPDPPDKPTFVAPQGTVPEKREHMEALTQTGGVDDGGHLNRLRAELTAAGLDPNVTEDTLGLLLAHALTRQDNGVMSVADTLARYSFRTAKQEDINTILQAARTGGPDEQRNAELGKYGFPGVEALAETEASLFSKVPIEDIGAVAKAGESENTEAEAPFYLGPYIREEHHFQLPRPESVPDTSWAGIRAAAQSLVRLLEEGRQSVYRHNVLGQSIITVADAINWLRKNTRVVTPQGGEQSATKVITELEKSSEAWKSLSLFDKLRIMAQLERPERRQTFSDVLAVSPRIDPERNRKLADPIPWKGKSYQLIGADTCRGCSNACANCYAVKVVRKVLGHHVPVLNRFRGKLGKNSMLRVGTLGDPATSWPWTISQVRQLVERSTPLGFDPKWVYAITKLMNLDGYSGDPSSYMTKLQVSVDPLYPAHMMVTLNNVLHILKHWPNVAMILRIRSVHSTNPELNDLIRLAVDFANAFGLPILETKMRFEGKVALRIIEAEPGMYEHVGNQYKAKGSPLKKFGPKDHWICNEKGLETGACAVCRNCVKFMAEAGNIAKRSAQRAEALGLNPIRPITLETIGGPEGLYQLEDQKVRGLAVITQAARTIYLFENAGPDTVIHELGHMFMADMVEAASQPNAPEGLVRDLRTLLDYVGAESYDKATEEQKEKIAKAFTVYVSEGRAPVPELSGLFQRFASWLKKIYVFVRRALGVRINDEVRDVFDRWLATEEDINEAKVEAKQAIVDAATKYPVYNAEHQRLIEEHMKRTAEKLGVERRRKLNRLLNVWRARAEAEASEMYGWLDAIRAAGGITMSELERAAGKNEARRLREKWGHNLIVKKAKTSLRNVGIDVAEALGITPPSAPEGLVISLLKHTDTRNKFVEDYIDEKERDFLQTFNKDWARFNERLEAVLEHELTKLNELTNTVPPDLDPEVRRIRKLFHEQLASNDVASYVAFKRAFRRAEKAAAEAYKRGRYEEAQEQKVKQLLAAKAIRQYYEAKIKRKRTLDMIVRIVRGADRLPGDFRDSLLTLAQIYKIKARQPSLQVTPNDIRQITMNLGFWLAMRPEVENDTLPHDIRKMTLPQLEALYTTMNAIRRAGRWVAESARREVRERTREFGTTVGARLIYRFGKPAEALLALNRFQLSTFDSISAYIDEMLANVTPLVTDRLTDLADKASVTVKELILKTLFDVMTGLVPLDYLPRTLQARVNAVTRRFGHEIVKVTMAYPAGQLTSAFSAFMRNPDAPLPDYDLMFFFNAFLQHYGQDMVASFPTPSQREKKGLEARRRLFRRLNSPLLKLETVTRLIDEWRLGPAFKNIFLPLYLAQEKHQALSERTMRDFEAVFERLKKAGKDLRELMTVPGFSQRITREEFYAVLLNLGNDGNLRNLLTAREFGGIGLTEADIDAITQMADADDWAFVVSVWRLLDKMWPEFAAVYKKVTGRNLKRVEGRDFSTPYGLITGGYYPLIFDEEISYRAAEINMADLAQMLFRSVYALPRPAHERTGKVLPPLLSLRVLQMHLNRVVQFIAYAEAVRDTWRLVHAPAFRATVGKVLGEERWRVLMSAIRDLAVPYKETITTPELVMRSAMANVASAYLFYVPLTLFKNTTQFFTSLDQVRLKWLMHGYSVFLRHPMKVWRDVRDASPLMRNRVKTMDATIREGFRRYFEQPGRIWTIQERIRLHGAYLIYAFDSFITIPAWLAEHDRVLAETGDPKLARAVADAYVERTQGGASDISLAEVQRGGGVMRKLVTLFYSFGSSMHQVFIERWWQARYGEISWARFATSMFIVAALPALMLSLTERRDKWRLTDPLFYTIMYLAQGVPILRDVLYSVFYNREYQLTPIRQMIQEVARLPVSLYNLFAADERDKRWNAFIRALRGVGYMSGMPVRAIEQELKAIHALQTGETKDPFVILYGLPPKR